MILPDTSVWIDYLGKQTRPQSRQLLQAARSNQKIYICAPILQEVLQGVRDETAFGRTRKQLDALPWAKQRDLRDTAIFAARLYARLRWSGITVRSPNDCLIAQIAIENGLALLHDDEDFIRIAKIETRLKFA